MGKPDGFFSFFVSLKSTGTFRTIGLLSDVYRIWAKIRMPLVRAWGEGVPRSDFAAGVGKLTDDAIGHDLLVGEAVADAQQAACLIADINKCYENIEREKLLQFYDCAFGCIVVRAQFDGTACSVMQSLVPSCSVALWICSW